MNVEKKLEEFQRNYRQYIEMICQRDTEEEERKYLIGRKDELKRIIIELGGEI